MNFEDSQRKLQEIIEKFDGDRYAATNYICRKSIELNSSVGDSLSISESISWAITNEDPKDIKNRINQHMNLKIRKTRYLEDLMESVMDERIEQAVRDSFDTSMKTGSLTFFYNDIRDKEIKARVRILTRMCWFHCEDER